MRRITLAILGTVAILVALFSYRTSLGGGAVALPAQAAHVVSGSASTPAAAAGPDPAGSTGAGSPGAISSGGGSTNDAPADPTTEAAQSAATPSGTSSPSSTAAQSGAAAASDKPVVADGTAQLTEHGPVQVQVTIEGGRITAVTALQYPSAERRSQQINAVALPQLSAEVIDAQSANIDVVSGATETTDGYVASLQSALDAAHFAVAKP